MAATPITTTVATAAADRRAVPHGLPAVAGVARIALALVLVTGGAWLAVELARRDADLGPPKGADRLIRAIDAEPAVTDADVAMARQVLRERPNDGRAYRVLAQFADARGQTEEATRLYGIAVRLAPRDRLTRAALADRAFARNDIPAALEHLDALLRVAPGAREVLLPQLGTMLDREDVRAGLVKRLRANPNWRGALVPALLADTTPVAGAETLLAALASDDVLTPAELDARVTLLQRMGRPDAARAVWLATLPPAQRALAGPALFDGGFEAPDITGGFAWQTTPQTGVTLLPDDSAPAEGRGSLSLVFEGRAVTGLGLEQPLALAPGEYQLTGRAANDTNAPRPFAFELVCASDGRILGKVALPHPAAGRDWQPFAGILAVPAGPCTAHRLHLRYQGRTLNERILSGTLRLDALDLRPR